MTLRTHRTLLLSLPWADFAFPSLKIGAVGAYAKSHGHAVDTRHAHLEAAVIIGLRPYAAIIRSRLGEGFSACLLFPNRSQCIFPDLERSFCNARSLVQRLRKALRKIYEGIPWNRYRLVGFTVDMDQIFASLLMAQWIKRDHPRIKVLFGGQCASDRLGAAIMRCFPQVDWCISGEGEIPFVSLLDHLASSKADVEPKVPGLIYRIKGEVRSNARAQLEDLAGLPDPDFDHYFETMEHHPLLSANSIDCGLPIEGGRGCTHRCAFCSYATFLHGYRRRPPKEIAGQMERLSRRYQVVSFHFADLRTQPDSDDSLFQLISRQGRDYSIFYEFRPDLGKPLLERMRRAGVSKGQIGIEALSTSLLRKMNKQSRFIENVQIMKFCTELGIDHTSNLMIGFPTETQRDIDESLRNIDYVLAYRPPVNKSLFLLMENSPIHSAPERFDCLGVRNNRFFDRILPEDLRGGMIFLMKDYRRRHRAPRYTALLQRYREWIANYFAARKEGKELLRYFDVGDFLRIEDRRAELADITLDGAIRELYLFCDSIRSFKEIRKRFPKVPEKELRKVLRQLFKLKVMYTEDDDWLSLAIHASPENRRHMPFL